MAFKRIYVIVMDSVGIGEEPDVNPGSRARN